MMSKEPIKREELIIENQNGLVPTLPDGQVILFEQFTILRNSWKWVVLVSLLVTGAVGFYVVTMVPQEFLGVAVALPPNKTGTPLDNLMGGISSSLKDAGLSKLVGGRSGSSGYSQTVLMTSRALLDSLLERYDLYSEYQIPRDRPDIMHDILAGKIEIDISAEGPITVNVFDQDPKRAAAMANDVVIFTNSIARDLNRRETEPIAGYLRNRYDYYKNRQDSLGARLQLFMSKNKIYDPVKQGAQMGEAQALAESQVAAARSKLTIMESTLGPEDPQVVLQRNILNEAIKRSQQLAAGNSGSLSTMPLANAPAAAREFALLSVELESNSRTLALIEPMYETANFDIVRDIPVLQLLDPALPAAKKARPRYTIAVAVTFFGTFVLCYVVIALLSYYRSFKRRYLHYTNGYMVPTRTVRIESPRKVESEG
jgi:hypothetical protein